MQNQNCREPFCALLRVGRAGLLGMAIATALLATRVSAQMNTTTVQGTIYRADGTPASGTLLISWQSFTTSQNQAVAAGNLSTTIAANGFVSVNLTPNAGALPQGSYYTAVYHLSDGTVNQEYWVVPAAATASVASVRAQLQPSTVAVQQSVSPAYVAGAISSVSSNFLPLTGGTMTGPINLSSDPYSENQAATKHYADTLAAESLPLSGGNLSGPLSAPSINGKIMADAQAGADASQKINAALGQLASGGGVVDATGLSGSQAWSTTVSITIPGTRLILGCGNYSGPANPMIQIAAPDVDVEGCSMGSASGGTVVSPSSGNGGVFAGMGANSPTYIENITLKNFSIVAGYSSFTAGSYLLELSNVGAFEVDGIHTDGNSGAANYGYLLVGAEQGEIHGGILLNSLVNVEWQRFALTQTAAANGVDFHGMWLTNGAGTNGINMQFAAGCCDDAEVSGNHFVEGGGDGLYNLDFETASSYIGTGRYGIFNNHFEITTSTVASCSDIYINNTNGVQMLYNSIGGCGLSPYTSLTLAGSSSTNIIRGNYGLGGVVTIAPAASQNIIQDNSATAPGGVTLNNSGVDTVVARNTGTLNWQDTFIGSSSGPDILEFRPKSTTSAPNGPVSANNGVTIEGRPSSSAGKETYLRWMGTDGSAAMTISCLSGTSANCFAHGNPSDGQNYWGWTGSQFTFGEAVQMNGALSASGGIKSTNVMAASINGQFTVDGTTNTTLNEAWTAAAAAAMTTGQDQTISLGPGTYAVTATLTEPNNGACVNVIGSAGTTVTADSTQIATTITVPHSLGGDLIYLGNAIQAQGCTFRNLNILAGGNATHGFEMQWFRGLLIEDVTVNDTTAEGILLGEETTSNGHQANFLLRNVTVSYSSAAFTPASRPAWGIHLQETAIDSHLDTILVRNALTAAVYNEGTGNTGYLIHGFGYPYSCTTAPCANNTSSSSAASASYATSYVIYDTGGAGSVWTDTYADSPAIAGFYVGANGVEIHGGHVQWPDLVSFPAANLAYVASNVSNNLLIADVDCLEMAGGVNWITYAGASGNPPTYASVHHLTGCGNYYQSLEPANTSGFSSGGANINDPSGAVPRLWSTPVASAASYPAYSAQLYTGYQGDAYQAHFSGVNPFFNVTYQGTIRTSGGIALGTIINTASTLTLTAANKNVIANAASGAQTITLPSCYTPLADKASPTGLELTIVKSDTSANAVTLQPVSSELIYSQGASASTLVISTPSTDTLVCGPDYNWYVTGTAAATVSGNSVTSFNGRTGAVVPQSGDYSSSYDALGAATTAQTNAEAFSANAANITSGKLPHAQLPTLLSTDIPNNAASTTGNASTASALAATPNQCATGYYATGVTASGAANCLQSWRFTWHGLFSGTFGTAVNTSLGSIWSPTAAITMTRLDIAVGTAAAGCSTWPVIGIYDGTSSTWLKTVTLTSGTYSYRNAVSGVSITAGHNLSMGVQTAGAGCTTSPGTAQLTMEYTMNQ